MERKSPHCFAAPHARPLAFLFLGVDYCHKCVCESSIRWAAASLSLSSIPVCPTTVLFYSDPLSLLSFLFSSSSRAPSGISSTSSNRTYRIHELVLKITIFSLAQVCLITTTRRKCFLSCWRLFESPSDKAVLTRYTTAVTSIPHLLTQCPRTSRQESRPHNPSCGISISHRSR